MKLGISIFTWSHLTNANLTFSNCTHKRPKGFKNLIWSQNISPKQRRFHTALLVVLVAFPMFALVLQCIAITQVCSFGCFYFPNIYQALHSKSCITHIVNKGDPPKISQSSHSQTVIARKLKHWKIVPSLVKFFLMDFAKGVNLTWGGSIVNRASLSSSV